MKREKETWAWKIKTGQCQYGLVTHDDSGKEVPAMKPTTLVANCPAMDYVLYKKCTGEHKRQSLMGRDPTTGKPRTAGAQRYPEKLCRALAQGAKLQKKWGNKGYTVTAAVGAGERGNR